MLTTLKDKYLIVDTNFISEAFKHIDYFENFFSRLEEINCSLGITQLVYLEMIRAAKNKTEKTQLDSLISNFFSIIKLDKDIINNTNKVYPLYNLCNVGKSQISVTDVINVGYLYSYGEDLLLLTLDHKDYPLALVDRVEVGAIDVGKPGIIVWGIYKFNLKKYQSRLKVYNRT